MGRPHGPKGVEPHFGSVLSLNQVPTKTPPPDHAALIKSTILKLMEYCRANNWMGYDPYDALNSRFFRALPFLNFKAARLVLTQSVKRCPVNLRPVLMVRKSLNPKGIALFLSSFVKLERAGLLEDPSEIPEMAKRLLSLRSPDASYSCWGYNFDWQTRGDLVPEGTPNIICTTFAGNALLDAYEFSQDPSWLEAAVSAAQFILDVLFWRVPSGGACFSYTPGGLTEVHNANLLGAAFLCRVGRMSSQSKFLGPAVDAARYSVAKQHDDGSWDYGESPTQRWIDNFHTGYNLVALNRIGDCCATGEFSTSTDKGLSFYKEHFFRSDCAPAYFHDRTYPIDIHSVSQSILTLLEFADRVDDNLLLALSVLAWAMDNMWDDRGFFYFQKRRHHTVRTPFMRWGQAWMLLALSALFEVLIYSKETQAPRVHYGLSDPE